MWGLMTLLAAFVALYAVAGIAAPAMRPELIAELFARRALLAFGHLGGGAVAIVAGALQFSAELRFKAPRVHRLLGRTYVVAVVVSGVAGGALALSSQGDVAGHLGFGMLAVLWVTTAVIAWRTAVARDYVRHRAWMIRSYALCLAAVTLRLWLPLSMLAGIPFESAYPAIAWLCWVPNLVMAEWLVIPGSLAPLTT
jgi:uncharacterized membrane protein